MITPAISVLSAVEGLSGGDRRLRALPSSPSRCAVLVGLFAIQRHGTAGIGRVFGPVMILWFVTIGVLGLVQIVRQPRRAARRCRPPTRCASSPSTAARGFLVLGSVFLAVTGGEALYADMGHFGRRPIRLAWLALVMPALVLCYFGQGALLLRQPGGGRPPLLRHGPPGRRPPSPWWSWRRRPPSSPRRRSSRAPSR